MIGVILTAEDYKRLYSGTDLDKANIKSLIDSLVALCQINEGSGAPTQKANKHTWYFDTATNKYYRNVDGGTTWVALN